MEFNKEKLIELRSKYGYSQKYVAVSVGVAPSVVSRWESGAIAPSRESLFKLSDLFGVSADYFAGRETEKQPTGNTGGLDVDLLMLLVQLDDHEKQRVFDFVRGIKAARKG